MIATFSFTSGTTGNPKAAMITQANFCALIAIVENGSLVSVYPSDRHLSYLPLAHIFERLISIVSIYVGFEVFYFSGDILKIKNDMFEAKPTLFISVPRLYHRIYDGIMK